MGNKSASSDYPKFLGESLTFDDVLLVPAYSEVLPVKLISLPMLPATSG
jgi:IMP dehydrogenase/GMP reductase